MAITVGIDIGQRRDHSAVCVAETEERSNGDRLVVHYLIRYLQRLPLGTSFPEVAKRAAEVTAGVVRHADGSPEIFVDATGIGMPAVDLIQEAVVSSRTVTPVYFTYGDRRTEDWPQVQLGKALLVGRLQMLLQTGRIHLPKTQQTEILARELLDYEIRVDSDANDRYGAFPVGTHDDLEMALGLAVQADMPHPGVVSGALPRPPGI